MKSPKTTDVPTSDARPPARVAPATPRAGVAKLTPEEQDLVKELCDEGQEAYFEMAGRFAAFGRHAFRRVFGGDSTAALGPDATKNPVWKALLAHAGGPRLRLNADMLRVAVRLAALDQRLNDDSFRGLDWSRKQLLLPLQDDDAIREAAQHVVTFKLDYEDTLKFVNAQREKAGKPPVSRVTPDRARKHLQKLVKSFTANRALPKLKSDLARLAPEEKQKLRDELRAARAVLTELDDALGRK